MALDFNNSIEASQDEQQLPPEVVEEGTKIVEEFLKTWASRQHDQDGGDVVMSEADDDSSESQLRELRQCLEEFRPRIEGNPWVQQMLSSLC